MRKYARMITSVVTVGLIIASCGSGSGQSGTASGETVAVDERHGAENPASVADKALPAFSADSAYGYVKRQVEFGPRVPGTEAHRRAGDWMAERLKACGAEVHEQKADLIAFDGTTLHARNIFARFNPEKSQDRLLLIAHYDTRPWADMDADEGRRTSPADGANDGASGVGILLETARILSQNDPGYGIDILLTDAEDYGTEHNDDSWALGTRHFAGEMRSRGWTPSAAILLDMVGGKNAIFPYEYFSRQAAPALDRRFRKAASEAGYPHIFPDYAGGAVTDDHLELIKQGVPAIDIIEYDPRSGFNPTWHTHDDNLENISKETLKAVGETLVRFIYTTDHADI